MTNLPKKLSDLIDVALVDLAKVERQKSKYFISMNSAFHEPDLNLPGKCTVCFAGAVMAKSLGVAANQVADPNDFLSFETTRRLQALDEIRQGHVKDALDMLDQPLPFGCAEDVLVASYSFDPTEFKNDMRKLGKLLRAAGQ